jgi:hypothetical protein
MDAPGLTQLLNTTPQATNAPTATPDSGGAGFTLQALQRLLYGSGSTLTQQQKNQLGAELYRLKEMGQDDKNWLGMTTDKGINPTEQAAMLQKSLGGEQFGWLQQLLGESGGAMANGPGPVMQVRQQPTTPQAGMDWTSGLVAGGEPAWQRTPEAPKLTSESQGKAISPFREAEQQAVTPPSVTQRGLEFGEGSTAPMFAPGAQTTTTKESTFDDMLNKYRNLPLFQPTMNNKKALGWSEGLQNNYQLSNMI